MRTIFIYPNLRKESARAILPAVCEQMSRVPPWAAGLPLRCDGYETSFYQKD